MKSGETLFEVRVTPQAAFRFGRVARRLLLRRQKFPCDVTDCSPSGFAKSAMWMLGVRLRA